MATNRIEIDYKDLLRAYLRSLSQPKIIITTNPNKMSTDEFLNKLNEVKEMSEKNETYEIESNGQLRFKFEEEE